MRFPFTMYKAGPNDYAIKLRSGKRCSEGKGKVFLVGPFTSIVAIPTTDIPCPFSFTEMTSDGQQVMVQGELQIRLDSSVIVNRRDFSVNPRTGAYLTQDSEKVNEEAVHALQAVVRKLIRDYTLKMALVSAAAIETNVSTETTANAQAFTDLGIKVIKVFVTEVSPANLDLKKALEATAREQMLSDADKAMAARREAASESDRKLREYEAETEKTLEEKKKQLIIAQNANLISVATAEAQANTERLAPYKEMDPMMVFALGIRELAASGRVGQLNITPELLAAMQQAALGKV